MILYSIVNTNIKLGLLWSYHLDDRAIIKVATPQLFPLSHHDCVLDQIYRIRISIRQSRFNSSVF